MELRLNLEGPTRPALVNALQFVIDDVLRAEPELPEAKGISYSYPVIDGERADVQVKYSYEFSPDRS